MQDGSTSYQDNHPNINETAANFTYFKSRSQELRREQGGLLLSTSLESSFVSSRRRRLKSSEIERNGLTLINSLPCGEMNNLFGHARLETGSGYNIMGKIGEGNSNKGGISLSQEREKQRVKMQMEAKDNLKLEYRVFSAWVTYVQLKKLRQKHQVVAQAFYYRKILLRFYKLLKLTYTTQRSLQQYSDHNKAGMEMAILRFKLKRERILVGIVFNAWVKYTNTVCREKAALRLKCDKFRRKTVLGKYLYVWRKRKDAKIILQEIELNHFTQRWHQLRRKCLLIKSINNWKLFVCKERKKRHLFVLMHQFQREKKARKYFTTWLELYRARHYQKSIMAEQFYANSYLPMENKISLQLSFGAWKKYWKNRLEKHRLSIIANSFFKRSILHKYMQIWLTAYIEETKRKLLIATEFHFESAQRSELKLKSVCFRALLRYKNKSTYNKLLFRSAQNFSTRRILSSSYQIWKQKWLLRTRENEQTCLSLWHWSSALKRKVFIGWRVAARKSREDRIKFSATVLATRDALQKQYIDSGILHQNSVLCQPVYNFLTGCNSKLKTYSSSVEKYALIWLRKYRRNKFYREKLSEENDRFDNVLDILERSDEFSHASNVLNNIEGISSGAPLPGILLDYIKEKSLTDYQFESPAVRKESRFSQLSTRPKHSKIVSSDRSIINRKQPDFSNQQEELMSNIELNLRSSNPITSDSESHNVQLDRTDKTFSEPGIDFIAGESELDKCTTGDPEGFLTVHSENVSGSYEQESETVLVQEPSHSKEISGIVDSHSNTAKQHYPTQDIRSSQLDSQKTFSVPIINPRPTEPHVVESNDLSDQVSKTPGKSDNAEQSTLQHLEDDHKIDQTVQETNIDVKFEGDDLAIDEKAKAESNKPRVPDFMRESIEGMGLYIQSAVGHQPEIDASGANSESKETLSASIEETLAAKLAREILDHSKTFRIPRNIEVESSENAQNVSGSEQSIQYLTYEVSQVESRTNETGSPYHEVENEELPMPEDGPCESLAIGFDLRSSAAIDPNKLMKPDDFASPNLLSSTPNNTGSLENEVNVSGLTKPTKEQLETDTNLDRIDCNDPDQDSNAVLDLCENHKNSTFDVDNINVSDLADVTLYANDLSTSIIQNASDEIDRLNKSFSEQNAAQNYESKFTNEISTQTDLSLLEVTNLEPKLGPNIILSQVPLCAKCGDLCNYQNENQNCESNNCDQMTANVSDSNQAQQSTVSSKLNQSKYPIELKRMVIKYKSLKAKSEKKQNDLKQLVADITAGQKSLDESQTGRIIELKSEIKNVNKQLKELKNSIKTYDQDRN